MAKSKNNLPSLIQSLGKTGMSGIPNLAGNSERPSAGKSLSPGRSSGAGEKALSAANLSSGIAFGRPASGKVATSSSGSDWAKLLEHTASSGLSSILGGGFGLGSIGGIGSILSGISSLFGGGKATPAPLVRFTLPAVQNQTISVSNNGSSGSAASSRNLQHQSTQIAQAVKTALLHSSSLNDVISEI